MAQNLNPKTQNSSRNYDAQIGRWLQPDPLMQHPSPYLAMSNNPISFTDPLGLWDDPIINSRGELVGDDGLNNGKYYMLDDIISVEDNINNKIYQTYHVHEISRDEYYSKKISYAGGMIMMSANGGYKQMGEAYGEAAMNYNSNFENWRRALLDPPSEAFNIDKAVNWLNVNAHETWKDARGECAKYVRKALEAGGLNTTGRPVEARKYSTFLPKLGFSSVKTSDFKKGDIAVINGYLGATADPKTGIPYGHIQMFNGRQ